MGNRIAPRKSIQRTPAVGARVQTLEIVQHDAARLPGLLADGAARAKSIEGV
jgi:hypothetical protein